MSFFKEVIGNRKSNIGKLDATIFFTNLFLILIHIILMVCYIIINHKFMIAVNIFSICFYILSYKFCVNNRQLYVALAHIEIWIHMLLALISFGWHASFQNWIFGLVASSFLPTFNTNTEKISYKKSFIFVGALMISYFLFSVLIYIIPFKIAVELPNIMLRFLFTFNNLVAFVTIIMFAITYTNNKERRELELTRKADFDELTNLYNRHALDELGKSVIEKAREADKPFSVAILDIDFFKNVNDDYGHASGDLVLKNLANILLSFSSKTIKVGRWGGEEFIIIGSHDIRYNEFVNLVKRLKTKVSKTKFSIENNKKINLTISAGCASIYDFKSLDEAVSIADNNLYKAKHSGRNKVIG